MEHSFDIEIAIKYGLELSIVYKHILFWIIKNKSHNKNFRDGCYWTYFSINSLQSVFPYFSIKQIRTILDKMKELNIIKVGNYNSQKYDRTLWYSFVEEPEELKKIIPIGTKEDESEKGKSICPNGQMEVTKRANGNAQMGLPIPYNKTYIKTNNKNIIGETQKRFIPPTIEEIETFCKEENIDVDAKQFFYWNDARDWMMGKSKMKRWKSAVRTWERKNKKEDTVNEFLKLGRE